MTDSFETLRLEVADAIATCILDRPEAHNAMSERMLDELWLVGEQVDKRSDVRVLILAGGDRAFSAGADLKERKDEVISASGMEIWRTLPTPAIERVASLRKPTIAAISGWALGGGLELALCCDLRVLSPTAKLGLPEARIGTIPGGGGTQRLPRIVGAGVAAELLFTGEPIDATRALALGLANVVADDWRGAAHDLATRIAANSPVSVQLIKHSMRRGLDVDLGSGLAIEAGAVAMLMGSDDVKEGILAFNEKRPPSWSGR
jgi:enoyl-CoA hydratase